MIKTVPILFIFCFCHLSKAQNNAYLPSIMPGNYWEYYAPFGMGLFGNIKYGLVGDTMINGVRYLKAIQFNRYVAGFREDTAQRKIYRILPDSTQEHLLFDFDLEVGDTVPRARVSNIDTVFLYGKWRRKISFNSPDYCYCSLIEGIGADNYGIIATHFPYYLVSFVEQTTQTDWLGQTGAQVFPNPSFGSISIRFPNGAPLGDQIFELFDEHGKLLRKGEISHFEKEKLIETGGNPGIFTLVLTDMKTFKKSFYRIFNLGDGQ